MFGFKQTVGNLMRTTRRRSAAAANQDGDQVEGAKPAEQAPSLSAAAPETPKAAPSTAAAPVTPKRTTATPSPASSVASSVPEGMPSPHFATAMSPGAAMPQPAQVKTSKIYVRYSGGARVPIRFTTVTSKTVLGETIMRACRVPVQLRDHVVLTSVKGQDVWTIGPHLPDGHEFVVTVPSSRGVPKRESWWNSRLSERHVPTNGRIVKSMLVSLVFLYALSHIFGAVLESIVQGLDLIHSARAQDQVTGTFILCALIMASFLSALPLLHLLRVLVEFFTVSAALTLVLSTSVDGMLHWMTKQVLRLLNAVYRPKPRAPATRKRSAEKVAAK